VSRGAIALLAMGAAACTIEAKQGEVGIYRAPAGASGSTALPDPDAPKPVLFLTMQLRDFKKFDAADPTTNPAFHNLDSEKSVVAETLGADHKPVYRAPDNDSPTFGAELFDQWYRDVPGTNYLVSYPLPLVLSGDGLYEFDSQKTGVPDADMDVDRRVFFPLDDGSLYATPFGNQGYKHNQAFTGEIHAVFTAAAGGTLQVRGDDDVYVFIDDQLVIDLGGPHAARGMDLDLDDLSLSAGEHALHVFYAERMGVTGDFMLRSSFALTSSIE